MHAHKYSRVDVQSQCELQTTGHADVGTLKENQPGLGSDRFSVPGEKINVVHLSSFCRWGDSQSVGENKKKNQALYRDSMCIPLSWVRSPSSHAAQTLGCGSSAPHWHVCSRERTRENHCYFSRHYTSDGLTQSDSVISGSFICKCDCSRHKVPVMKRHWWEVSVSHIHSEKLQSKVFVAGCGAGWAFHLFFIFLKCHEYNCQVLWVLHCNIASIVKITAGSAGPHWSGQVFQFPKILFLPREALYFLLLFTTGIFHDDNWNKSHALHLLWCVKV